jgi:hypothetical protein
VFSFRHAVMSASIFGRRAFAFQMPAATQEHTTERPYRFGISKPTGRLQVSAPNVKSQLMSQQEMQQAEGRRLLSGLTFEFTSKTQFDPVSQSPTERRLQKLPWPLRSSLGRQSTSTSSSSESS